MLRSNEHLAIGSKMQGGTAGSVIFLGTLGVFAQDNANFYFDDTNNRLGVQAGTSLGTAGFQFGTGGTQNSSDCAFVNLRTLNDASGAGSAHGFGDNVIITRTGTIGYCSFDARVNANVALDHCNGFQFYPTFNFAGTTSSSSGYTSAPVVNAGTVSTLYNFTCADATGAGTVSTQYGLYVPQLSKGASVNYAIYTAGTTKSRFLGIAEFLSDVNIDGTGTLVLDTGVTLGWGATGTADVQFVRVSADVFAMRRGTTGQQFRFQNTYTSDVNQEFAQLTWSSNVFIVQTNTVGGSARAMTIGASGSAALNLQMNGSVRWLVNTSAQLIPNTNGTLDFGLIGSMIRNAYVGTLDAGTTTIVSSLIATHNSSGTAAAGLGVSIVFQLQSSTTASQSAGRIRSEWDVATHASRRNFLTLSTYDAGTERDTLRLGGDGTRGFAGVLVGVSTQYAKVGGTIFDHLADGSSTHTDGTEDDLYSDTLAASTFGANGDKVEARYCVVVVSSGTATRRIQAYVAGTAVLDSTSLTFASAGTIEIRLLIIRESSTVLRVYAVFVEAGITAQPIVTYTRITGLTLTNTQIVKITGIAAGVGAASGDIVAKLGALYWKAAA